MYQRTSYAENKFSRNKFCKEQVYRRTSITVLYQGTSLAKKISVPGNKLSRERASVTENK